MRSSDDGDCDCDGNGGNSGDTCSGGDGIATEVAAMVVTMMVVAIVAVVVSVVVTIVHWCCGGRADGAVVMVVLTAMVVI